MNTPPTDTDFSFESAADRFGKRAVATQIVRSTQHPRSLVSPTIDLHPEGKRILVFDDDSCIRRMLRRIFERTGHHVFTFSAPSPCSTCHCRIGERCADVLLSDLSMPGMRGIDFLENQRRIGCKIDTMGLMSGSWKEQDQRRARKLGCRIFSKPFDIHELYHWVNGDSGRSQRVLVDHIFQNRSTKWIDKSQLT